MPGPLDAADRAALASALLASVLVGLAVLAGGLLLGTAWRLLCWASGHC